MNKPGAERPLRILHFILALTPTNGQYNEHCLPLRHMREITICTYFKSKITPPPELTLYDGDGSLRGFYRAARAALEEKEYDVIHVHTPHAGVLLLMTLFLSGLYRKLKPITVHTVQNSFQSFKLRNKALFLPSFALFQQLIFCSYASFESFPGFYKWLGRGRMDVVQNCVDLERIDGVLQSRPATHADTRTDTFGIVTVGLIEMKNPFTVVEAFRQCHDPDNRLTFLGKGNLQPLVSAEVEKLALQDQVTMTGMIERDDVFGYFGDADLFVSTSWGEGLPVAVLEAMACRCPVVLSDIPPHREIANKTDCIPLVNPNDPSGFTQEIERFRRMTGSERRAIGQKCRELIEEQFSLPVMHSEYAKIYSQVTGNPELMRLEEIRELG